MIHSPGPDLVSRKGKKFKTTLCGIRFHSEYYPTSGKDIIGQKTDCRKCLDKQVQKSGTSVDTEYPVTEDPDPWE